MVIFVVSPILQKSKSLCGQKMKRTKGREKVVNKTENRTYVSNMDSYLQSDH